MNSWRSIGRGARSLVVGAMLAGNLAAYGTAQASTPGAAAISARGHAGTAVATSRATMARMVSAIPLAFEPDGAASPRQEQFVAHADGFSLALWSGGMQMTLAGRHGAETSGVQFVHANRQARAVVLHRLPGRVNYFIGNNPRLWRTNVATYDRIEYRDVYPGINLVYHSSGGRLEYDWVLGPHANPNAIRLRVGGAGRMRFDAAGNLLLGEGEARLEHFRPVVYQWIDGRRLGVSSRYTAIGANEVGFHVGRYDTGRPVVIDPTIGWSTYISGSGHDKGNGIAVSGSTVYVGGETQSTNLPKPIIKACTVATGSVCADAFVTAIDTATGTINFTTYVGGTNDDWANALAVDGAGSVYIAGETHSLDLPMAVTQCDSEFGYCDDAFVAKLDGNGGLIHTSTVGGTHRDYAKALTVDNSGRLFVTGWTSSTDLRGASNLCPFCQGAFVAELDSTSLVQTKAMYFAGSYTNEADAIATDGNGDVYIAGSSQSSDLPGRVNACSSNCSTYPDAYVAEVQPAAGTVSFSMYIGGSQINHANGLALRGGILYVAGETYSSDMPSATNSCTIDPTTNTCRDAFLAQVDPVAKTFRSTYFGGNRADAANGLAVGAAGDIYLTGYTSSTDLAGALNGCHPAPAPWNYCRYTDAFVAHFTSSGTLVSSMYLGGIDQDVGTSIALDGSGNGYITGLTNSADLPNATNNCIPFYPSCGDDAFVMQVVGLDGAPAQAAAGANPNGGINGAVVALNGANFGPNEQVDFFWDDVNNPLAAPPAGARHTLTASATSVVTDSKGSFTASITVPASTGGHHQIIAVGRTSGKRVSIPFTVQAHIALLAPSAAPGTTVSLTASGFGAGETVIAGWNSATDKSLGHGTTSSTGGVTFSFTVPSSATSGPATVYVTGSPSSLSAFSTFMVQQTASSATRFRIDAPANAMAGQPVTVAVTALGANNNVATGYTGTATLTATDAKAQITPASHAFTSSDAGKATFQVSFVTPGTTTLSAKDTQTASMQGSSNVQVAAGPAHHFTLALPTTAVVGQSIHVTVTVRDSVGNAVTGYTGTVTLASSDRQAILPAPFSFGGASSVSVSMTPKAAGTQTITVSAQGTPSLTGTGSVTVQPATGPTTRTVTVPAKQTPPGADTGLAVAAGMQVSVVTTGRGTYGYEGAGTCGSLPYTDPDGQRYPTATSTVPCGPKIDTLTSLPSAPIGTLLGHILASTTTTSGGSLFALGSRHIFAAQQTGRFYLLYNDEPYGYSNNSGGYSVTITVCDPSKYLDVPSGSPYHDVITTVARKGILLGYPNCTFQSSGIVTQGQLASVLALATAQHPTSPANPNTATTRLQLAQMAIATAGMPLITPTGQTFADVPPTSPFYRVVETAARAGLVAGIPCGGTLHPCDSQNRPYFLGANLTTRAQVAWAASKLGPRSIHFGPVSYEGEAAINTLTGGAVVNPCGFCSGGQYVRMIGGGGTITFNGISVPAAGTYRLTLSYVNGDHTRPACVGVNLAASPTGAMTGCGSGIALQLPSTDWSHVQTFTLNVTLRAGTNSIAYYSPNAWAPDIDKITIVTP